MLLFGKYYGFSVYKYYMLHISLIGFCEMCKKYFCAWCFIWEMGLQFGIYNIFGIWLYFQFWYFTYGTKDVLERECKDLHTKLKVSLIASSLSHVTLLCVAVTVIWNNLLIYLWTDDINCGQFFCEHTHTQPFNGLLSGTSRVGQYRA